MSEEQEEYKTEIDDAMEMLGAPRYQLFVTAKCPFCEGDTELFSVTGIIKERHFVSCKTKSCADGRIFDTKLAAIENWNAVSKKFFAE